MEEVSLTEMFGCFSCFRGCERKWRWGPDDAHCCASVYERWTFRLEFSVATGSYSLKHVDSKPAKPVPLRPGEKRLPTAQWIPNGSED
jgi:hypothetical protein